MLPSTPAGKQAAALIQTFNEGNGRTMLTFIQEHYAKAFLAKSPAPGSQRAGELWVHGVWALLLVLVAEVFVANRTHA